MLKSIEDYPFCHSRRTGKMEGYCYVGYCNFKKSCTFYRDYDTLVAKKLVNNNMNRLMSMEQIIKIEWLDSALDTNQWYLKEDIDKAELDATNAVTVGMIVKETDDYIVVAQNYGNNPPQYSGLITIPKGCIKSRKYLLSNGSD